MKHLIKHTDPATKVESFYADDGNGQVRIFVDEEAARVFIHEKNRLGNLPGDYHDYTPVPCDAQGNVLERVPEDERQQIIDDLTQMLKTSSALQGVANMMLASRHMYVMAVHEMEDIIAEHTFPVTGSDERRSANPRCGESLIKQVSQAANQSFVQLDLFQALVDQVMPFMQTRITQNVKKDHNDRQAELTARLKARADTLVPIGIPTGPNAPARLTRGQSLILGGYGPAVLVLLDYITNAAAVASDESHPDHCFTVARFKHDLHIDPEQAGVNERYMVVDRHSWQGMARSLANMQQVTMAAFASKLRTSPDLIIFDDISALTLPSITGSQAVASFGGEAPYVINDTHKKVKKMASQFTAAVVAGVLSPVDKPVDFSKPEWTTLRTHAVLRPVTVIRKANDLPAGKVRIVVGQESFKLDVDAALLDPQSTQLIV